MQAVPRNGDIPHRLPRQYSATGKLLFRDGLDARVFNADLARDPVPSEKVPYQANKNAELICLGEFIAGNFPHPGIGRGEQNVVAALLYANLDVRRLRAGHSRKFTESLKKRRGRLKFPQQTSVEVMVSDIRANPPSQNRIFVPSRSREKRPGSPQWDEHIRIVAQHRQSLAMQMTIDWCTDVAKKGSERHDVPHPKHWRREFVVIGTHAFCRAEKPPLFHP
ncbi:MAG: hypothetical protein ABF309_01510 [Desulfobacterales bacterium]